MAAGIAVNLPSRATSFANFVSGATLSSFRERNGGHAQSGSPPTSLSSSSCKCRQARGHRRRAITFVAKTLNSTGLLGGDGLIRRLNLA